MNHAAEDPVLIHFSCEACSTQLTAPEALAGHAGPCPTCSALVTAPLRPAPLEPPAATSEPAATIRPSLPAPAGVELETVLHPERRRFRPMAVAACAAVLAGVGLFGWFMKTYGTLPGFRDQPPGVIVPLAARPDRTGSGWLTGTFTRPKSGLILQQGHVILQLSQSSDGGPNAMVGLPCGSMDAGRLARAVGDLGPVQARAKVHWSGGPREYRMLVVDGLEPVSPQAPDELLAEWEALQKFLNASTWNAAKPTIAATDLPVTGSPPAGWDFGLFNRYGSAVLIPLAEVAIADGHRTLWSARTEGVAATLQCVTERKKGQASVRFAPRPTTGALRLPTEQAPLDLPSLAAAVIQGTAPGSGRSVGAKAPLPDRDGPDRLPFRLSASDPLPAATEVKPAIQ